MAAAQAAGGKSAVPHTRPALRIELSLKTMLTVVAVVVGLWLVVKGLPALLVLVAALMFVGALHPLVLWLEAHKVRRFLAICLVFGGSVAVAAAVILVTAPALVSQVKVLAAHEPKIRQSIADYLDQSRLTTAMADDVRNTRATEFLKSISGRVVEMSTRILEIGAYLVAAVFLAFYMMVDRDRLRGALFAVVPRPHHIRLSRILLSLGSIVGGYIRGQMLTCMLMGIFIFVVLTVCGVPNALGVAVFGGVMDLFPYIGAILTIVPVVLIAATQGSTTAIVVLVLMLGYEELESRVLVPWVYGRTLRLPSSVIFFSLILGTALAGILGALLALPIAAAVLMLVEEMRVELPGETLQPADVAQRRKDNRTNREYRRRTENLSTEDAAEVALKLSAAQKASEEAAPGGR